MRKFGGFSTGSNGNVRNGVLSAPDQSPSQVSVGIRSGANHKQQSRYGQHHHHRRLVRGRKISVVGALVFFLFAALLASVFVFIYFFPKDKDMNGHSVNIRKASKMDDVVNDTDFLSNVTRTAKDKVLRFGNGSVTHGRDSRYWDGDDRRRDEDYNEEDVEQTRDGSADIDRVPKKVKDSDKKSSIGASFKNLNHKDKGLYNEAGRNELKMYEAEYVASIKSVEDSKGLDEKRLMSHDAGRVTENKVVDADDEYDDGIDLQDTRTEDGEDAEDAAEKGKHSDIGGSHNSHSVIHEIDEALKDLSDKEAVPKRQSTKRSVPEKRSGSKKKPKRHKSSGCEMKLLNSTTMLVEPLESRKFARFSLQYTETEENPSEEENWVSKFGGHHQSLIEREESFKAHDQKIDCGFVSKGFDLAEDDAKYLSSCHIAVVSCIFGNSDRLRIPVGKMVSRLSRKNVCFVMFVDEATLQALSSDGLIPDRMGYIGLWKIVVVRNLPYADMRRVGKIPKLLSHRLFPSARYSIWLDSKLRLQLDPLVILEYFLWRKGYEYAISNHYDRHCVWEEVAQNKKLNKYNHSVIDEQFEFYRGDGLKRFNALDPSKLLPSNVPEGSLIVRAHTPMSNLFSCLWFNEVDRFTPRDQLSFAYTYYKLRRMNPGKPFYLNMFKDCERRKIAKLFRHRSQESKNTIQLEIQ